MGDQGIRGRIPMWRVGLPHQEEAGLAAALPPAKGVGADLVAARHLHLALIQVRAH